MGLVAGVDQPHHRRRRASKADNVQRIGAAIGDIERALIRREGQRVRRGGVTLRCVIETT
jgi:hypothetical protein